MKENKSLFTGLLVGAILAGALMYFFMQKKADQVTASLDIKHQTQYAMLIDSVRQSGLVNLMGSLLEKVEKELAQSPDRTLSDATIMQISALSDGFKPYAILKGDQLSSNEFSPERGHLLLMLLGMEMDSFTWQEILSSVTFENADLKGADIHEANLSGANLSAANFKEAKLKGIKLINANLRGVNMSGANLSQADLRKSDLTTADLRWADLKQADLSESILKGAQLSSANLRHANLKNAIAERVILNDAFLDFALLEHINLLEASLDRVHLKNTSFRNANLVLTTFRETDLFETDIDSAIVKSEKWFSGLIEWNVPNVEDLQIKYAVVKDTSAGKILFRLQKSVK